MGRRSMTGSVNVGAWARGKDSSKRQALVSSTESSTLTSGLPAISRREVQGQRGQGQAFLGQLSQVAGGGYCAETSFSGGLWGAARLAGEVSQV
jgi:hypothetical protein